MSNRKAWVWIVASGAIALCGFRLAAFEQGEAKGLDGQLPGLMLAKLANTQRVVAGLVAKDFGEIRRGAEDMLRVCDAEQWGRMPTPSTRNTVVNCAVKRSSYLSWPIPTILMALRFVTSKRYPLA